MTYIVCIPNYNKAALCNEKTLDMLRAHNVPTYIYIYMFMLHRKRSLTYIRKCWMQTYMANWW